MLALRLLLCWAFWLSLFARGEKDCELLQTSLTYRQDEAPSDLSGVLPLVVDRINRVLEGVVDVEVEWRHLQDVGEHLVRCTVTRLAAYAKNNNGVVKQDEHGRSLVTQCFSIPFTIRDTNECLLREDHPMRHRCHASTTCVNTIGSYECVCGDTGNAGSTVNDSFWNSLKSQTSAWKVALPESSCAGSPSTHGCCPANSSSKSKSCHTSFRCPVNPCLGRHECVRDAKCSIQNTLPTDFPYNYECVCPRNLLGHGRKCKPNDPKPAPTVGFDGTASDDALDHCDCTQPIVDACAGFPPCNKKHQVCVVTAGNKPECGCAHGYVMHDEYECVDESPPVLSLKNDNGNHSLRLKQGDVYQEYAVEIQDENAEEYMRSLKIAYSQPLPQGCFVHMGEFHVNYTVATRWTSPPYVRVTRKVIIDDVNECDQPNDRFATSCPALVPQCDPLATCVNTIGSYECKCPEYMTGDGFRSGDLPFEPPSYNGGTGCVDKHKPIITLHGPNPKVFPVCSCTGVNGVLSKRRTHNDDRDLHRSQQGLYHNDIKELIKNSGGAELCASHTSPRPNMTECVQAYDQRHDGKVDLSGKVHVGDPEQKSALRWSVPYNVRDAAGNDAITVWRDVVVEEVESHEIAARVRNEALADMKKEIDKAVEKAKQDAEKDKKAAILAAIEEDRKTHAVDKKKNGSCPLPPKCDCKGKIDMAKCNSICEKKIESCAINEEGFVIRSLLWMENYFPIELIPILLFVAVVATTLVTIRWFFSLFWAPYYQYPAYIASDERERAMRDSVTVFSPTTPAPTNGYHYTATPGSTMAMRPTPTSASVNNSIFGSGHASVGSQPFSPHQPQGSGVYQDIYASPDIISPRRPRGLR